MATEAQILANRANSKASSGPTSQQGKLASSQNARKRSLRAVREDALRGETFRYEERKRKWISDLDPRTDREEYLAHQQVLTSLMMDRANAAYIEKVTTDLEETDEREEEDVDELAERLYFNRAGIAATYGCRSSGRNKENTSVSKKSVDPDGPKKLVNALAKSARGCRWLIKEWTELKERLEGSKFWQSVDRFRAIRLSGKQPADSGYDRFVAEIMVASHAIEPPLKTKADYDLGTAGNLPAEDLLGDMTAVELDPFVETVRVRWPDMVSSKDKARCRAILVELVDRKLERLAAKLKKHQKNTEKYGQKSVDRTSFARDRDGELIQRYRLRYERTCQFGQAL